jgi:hypothetical protein
LFAQSLFVDLGYGFDARTTLEIEKERVEAALPYADEKTFFDWVGLICR